MVLASRIRAVLVGAALLCLTGGATVDTIVLKNGRGIIRLSAFEEGEKVKYLTSGGELSLPKSIVDHIEKGGAGGLAGVPGANAGNLAIAPPATEPSGAIAQGGFGGVYHGAVDRGNIAKLGNAARSGGPEGKQKDAPGGHMA